MEQPEFINLSAELRLYPVDALVGFNELVRLRSRTTSTSDISLELLSGSIVLSSVRHFPCLTIPVTGNVPGET